MSVFDKLKRMFGSDASAPELVVKNVMTGLYQLNINACIEASNKWKPTLTLSSFADECSTRLDYLRGSMQGDMLDVLKRRFPITYKDIINEQVNVRLYKKIIEDQAKTFNDSTFVLCDESGARAPADDSSSIAFDKMIVDGNFDTCFRDADRQIHSLYRLAIVLRYDPIRRCVRPMVWPQHLVHWVPDPDMYYVADASVGVLLEVAPEAGVNDVESKRYEVWAKIPDGDSVVGLHYYSGKNSDKYYERPVSGNEQRLNPYIDPRTGVAMYPIVWWQADIEPALYWLPDEDALTIPRMFNSALTDINWGMHYGTHPILSWEYQAGAEMASPPPATEIGPGRCLSVAGLHPRFTHPGYNPEPMMQMWSTLSELETKIGGGVPISLLRDSGSPESGYALRIRNMPLEEHRTEMINVLRHHVEETLYRAAVVWNQYRDDKIDIEKYRPKWIPGDISVPLDESESTTIHASRVAANVESVVEWRMSVTGESEQQAREAIAKNAEENGAAARAGSSDFPPLKNIGAAPSMGMPPEEVND